MAYVYIGGHVVGISLQYPQLYRNPRVAEVGDRAGLRYRNLLKAADQYYR